MERAGHTAQHRVLPEAEEVGLFCKGIRAFPRGEVSLETSKMCSAQTARVPAGGTGLRKDPWFPLRGTADGRAGVQARAHRPGEAGPRVSLKSPVLCLPCDLSLWVSSGSCKDCIRAAGSSPLSAVCLWLSGDRSVWRKGLSGQPPTLCGPLKTVRGPLTCFHSGAGTLHPAPTPLLCLKAEHPSRPVAGSPVAAKPEGWHGHRPQHAWATPSPAWGPLRPQGLWEAGTVCAFPGLLCFSARAPG